MTNGKKAALIGCGCLSLAALGLCIAVGVWFSLALKDPEGLSVSIDGPTDAAVGQTFDLTVQVTNERPAKTFNLSDIDISYDYLDGFVVVSTEPPPQSSEDNAPFDNSRSFTFEQSIPPGESMPFVFTLRAETPGIYRGDVDVYEGMRFTTAMAQTVVREAEAAPLP